MAVEVTVETVVIVARVTNPRPKPFAKAGDDYSPAFCFPGMTVREQSGTKKLDPPPEVARAKISPHSLFGVRGDLDFSNGLQEPGGQKECLFSETGFL